MSKAVFCIARSQAHASTIVDALRGEGFSLQDVSVLYSDSGGRPAVEPHKGSKAPEGATAGASAGGAIGGTLGLLAGIGTLAIPGVGPFIAAGPIMATLSGVAIGSAIGGVAGALVGLGIPEVEAKVYEGKLRSGRAMVAVHVRDDNERDKAQAVFENCGGEDIDVAAEKRAEG
jgi:hypothetical protein